MASASRSISRWVTKTLVEGIPVNDGTTEIGNVDTAYLSPGLNLSASPFSPLAWTWSWVEARFTIASDGTASWKGVVCRLELFGVFLL